MKRRLSSREVWGAPAAIALASVVGLLAALLGDGPWDAVSWLALAVPTVVSFHVLGKIRHRAAGR